MQGESGVSDSMVMSGLFERGVTVSFGERFARSEQFDAIFREGMQLVEETAEYLDGRGRKDAKTLKPPISVAYATESMRLTTRLLDLASWLLVQRSLKEGEITVEEASARREGMKLRPFGRPSHIKYFDDLPAGLRALIERSYTMGDRISQLDQALQAGDVDTAEAARNAVNDQIQQLHAAFAATGQNRA